VSSQDLEETATLLARRGTQGVNAAPAATGDGARTSEEGSMRPIALSPACSVRSDIGMQYG